MGSQTEQSPSPELQQPDLFSQDSLASDLDSEIVVAPEAAEAEAEAAPSTDDVVVTTDDVAEEPLSWGSLDDIKLDAFNDDVRPHVERVLNFARGHIEQRVQSLAQSEADFRGAKGEFDDLIKRLNEADTEEGGMEKLSNELQQTRTTINTLSDNHVQVAWRAFTAEHPEYEKTPPQMRESFAKLIEDDGFNFKFRGKTLVDRLNDAYNFSAYTNGVDLTRLSNATHPAVPPQMISDARRQSVIADGAIATARPVQSIDEQTWDEIRNRHDYLLDELNIG